MYSVAGRSCCELKSQRSHQNRNVRVPHGKVKSAPRRNVFKTGLHLASPVPWPAQRVAPLLENPCVSVCPGGHDRRSNCSAARSTGGASVGESLRLCPSGSLRPGGLPLDSLQRADTRTVAGSVRPGRAEGPSEVRPSPGPLGGARGTARSGDVASDMGGS